MSIGGGFTNVRGDILLKFLGINGQKESKVKTIGYHSLLKGVLQLPHRRLMVGNLFSPIFRWLANIVGHYQTWTLILWRYRCWKHLC